MVSPVFSPDTEIVETVNLSPADSVFVAIGLIVLLIFFNVVKSADEVSSPFQKTIESLSIPLLVSFALIVFIRVFEQYG